MTDIEPRANPPVTVGELTDVPAPGSPIASAWAQEVSNRIMNRFATKTALDAWAAANGSIGFTADTGTTWVRVAGVWRPSPSLVSTNSAAFTDIATGTTGVKDVGVVGPATPFSYAVTAIVSSTLYFGNGAVQINASADLVLNTAGTSIAAAPGPIAAPAGAFIAVPLAASIPIAAGADARIKARLNISAMASGACHTGGNMMIFYL